MMERLDRICRRTFARGSILELFPPKKEKKVDEDKLVELGRLLEGSVDRLSVLLDTLEKLVTPGVVEGDIEGAYWRCQVCSYTTRSEPEVWVCPMCGATGTQSVLVKVIPEVAPTVPFEIENCEESEVKDE